MQETITKVLMDKKVTPEVSGNKREIIFEIVSHELGYVMNFLLDEYYKTWNPFKKKKMRKIMNKFHRYMFPNFGDLFEEGDK